MEDFRFDRDGSVVEFKFSTNTEIDVDLLNLLASGSNPSFLACSYRVEEPWQVISFDAKNCYTLKDYVDNKFDNFQFFLSEIFQIVSECRRANIPLHDIVIDFDAMFFKNGHSQLIVLPLPLDKKIKFDAKELFKKIIRLFVLPNKTKKRLLNIVRTARGDDDALARIVAFNEELGNSQKNKLPFNEEFSSEAETGFFDSASEAETTFLAADDEN